MIYPGAPCRKLSCNFFQGTLCRKYILPPYRIFSQDETTLGRCADFFSFAGFLIQLLRMLAARIICAAGKPVSVFSFSLYKEAAA